MIIGRACPRCGRATGPVPAIFDACRECLRREPDRVLPAILRRHAETRREFGLPAEAPRAPGGAACSLCLHECRIPEGGRSYCGLRTAKEARLVHLGGTADRGVLHWYHDPLPTNCVADWVCSGNRQVGWKNLAVFYGSCTMNCLFCQNWHCRDRRGVRALSAAGLAEKVDARTYCICFFGGDPTPQMPHALATARLLPERVRVCWETNGTMAPSMLEQAVELSMRSGGCVKLDLKAWDDNLHLALTGASNRRALESFALAAKHVALRREPPVLVASTLLVPGYVDAEEVGHLARFIAELDPAIPYSLLAFGPAFHLADLPCTSVRQAEECLGAARGAGLLNVRLGNRHLLAADGL